MRAHSRDQGSASDSPRAKSLPTDAWPPLHTRAMYRCGTPSPDACPLCCQPDMDGPTPRGRDPTPEARAPQVIDAALTTGGWIIEDRDEENIHAGPGSLTCASRTASHFRWAILAAGA